jgi:molybdate transport system ATP-binding protein
MSVLEANFILKRPQFMLEMNCAIDTRITGIFGPSGAGKTSIVKAISGLEHPEEGFISIADRVVFSKEHTINLPPEKRSIGYVFQEGRLFPHMNVAKNLKYGLKKNYDTSYFNEVVDLLKITDILDKSITQISGGQSQRVAIGRALLSSPQLLVLDEPFSSLDKSLRFRIISLLKPLIDRFDIPMLVISHDLTDLIMLSENLLIIKNGRCVGHGNYYDLIGKHEALQELNKSGLLNTVELQVEDIDEEKGLLIGKASDKLIVAESPINGHRYIEKQVVKLFLRPEDVTLALHHIEDISIQNQIEGTIEKLIFSETKVLCMIDHGFRLIAEVTLATAHKMKLAEGSTIWSLFKAAALKSNMYGVVNSNET